MTTQDRATLFESIEAFEVCCRYDPKFAREYGKKVKQAGGRYTTLNYGRLIGSADTRWVTLPVSQILLLEEILQKYGKTQHDDGPRSPHYIIVARGEKVQWHWRVQYVSAPSTDIMGDYVEVLQAQGAAQGSPYWEVAAPVAAAAPKALYLGVYSPLERRNLKAALESYLNLSGGDDEGRCAVVERVLRELKLGRA